MFNLYITDAEEGSVYISYPVTFLGKQLRSFERYTVVVSQSLNDLPQSSSKYRAFNQMSQVLRTPVVQTLSIYKLGKLAVTRDLLFTGLSSACYAAEPQMPPGRVTAGISAAGSRGH